jgi:probable rRNA maturation factor
MNIIVEIATESEKWSQQPEINSDFFSGIVRSVLSQHPNFQVLNEVELSILLTDNERMTKLNNEFRNKNNATNVLSFPDLELDWRTIVEFIPDADYMYFGDIAFGYDIINSEAKMKSISFQDHFYHLTIHAIFHILGYDHMSEDEARIMENMEVKILDIFGIKSPY